MQGTRILIVEDESIVAMHLKNKLRQFGYSIAHASSGEEAMVTAAEFQPELAMMDIMLGGQMDGIETAQRLKDEFNLSIIYLTAYTDEDTVERAKLTQPMGYLVKPFRDEELRSAIDVALFRHQNDRRLREKESMLNVLLESTQDGVVIVGPDKKVRFMNQAARELAGTDSAVLDGGELTHVFGKLEQDKQTAIGAAVSKALVDAVSVDLAKRAISFPVGSDRRYSCNSVAPMHDAGGKVNGALILFRKLPRPVQPEPPGADARKWLANGSGAKPSLKRLDQKFGEEKSSFLATGDATLDPLTGLPSRAEAEQAIAAAMEQHRAACVIPFALDRFNLITKRYGQTAADELVLFYSIHLAQGLTPEDQLFRWTGPSFVVLMERSGSVEEVRRDAARLAAVRLEKVLRVHERTALLLVSAGWSVLPMPSQVAPEDLFRQVDSFVAAQLKN